MLSWTVFTTTLPVKYLSIFSFFFRSLVDKTGRREKEETVSFHSAFLGGLTNIFYNTTKIRIKINLSTT